MSDAKMPERWDLVGELPVLEYDLDMVPVEDGDWIKVEDVQPLLDEITRLRTEVLEQARLLGMGGEREAKLRAENDHLKRARSDALAGGDALREEITRLRAGLQKIVDADGFWDAPSLARDLLQGKDVT